MKRVLLVTAALVAAVAVLTLVSLPPARLALNTSVADTSIPGVLHIHTNRSDGRSAPDEIAAAARRAGLKFIVFTDHGDATRQPDPPSYRSGVLCLDAVEISTTGGHYVALDMGAAPYPLAGEPRDVVEDVRRLGGFGIAAHPDSPKPELQWTDWDAPIDGVELINPDTAWRIHMLEGGWRPRMKLLRALFTYPVRASETIDSLLTDSPQLEQRWTALTAERPVVGTAGVDAHAKLELRAVDAGDNRFSLPVPGYESSFRSLSVHVATAEPMTGDAAADGASIIKAIRAGRLYTAVDAWAAPALFEFTASNRSGTAQAGETLATGGPVALHVRSNAPPGFRTTVWRGSDALVKDQPETDLTLTAGEEPAVYRAEIRAANRPGGPPWIIGNPIYVRGAVVHDAAAPRPAARQALPLFDGRTTLGWSTEKDETSVAAIDAVQMIAATEFRLRYGLAGGSSVGQYAGAAVETARGVAEYDRIAFTIRAEHPLRVSVQVRAEFTDAPPERWQRSLYVDATDSERLVSFDDMRPVGITRSPRPVRENVHAIMLIVDTTNSKPGASGRIWLKNIRLER